MLRVDQLKKFATFGFILCVVLACKSLGNIGNPTTLKSTDGKFQLTVPAGWTEEPTLNASASIGADNKSAELYVIVISELKSEFAKDMTLDKFTDITRNAMMTKTTSTDSSKPKQVTVNGNDGREYDLKGIVESTNIAYLVTTVETPDHFHQVITWTLPSKYDQSKATLQQVIDSFRPLSSDSTTDPHSSPSTKR